MAVRFDAPIYTTQQVLNDAGILLDIEDAAKDQSLDEAEEVVGSEDLSSLSMEELQNLLDQSVKEEDYDTALELQEEIKRRKKKID